jgi:hypothetical protein
VKLTTRIEPTPELTILARSLNCGPNVPPEVKGVCPTLATAPDAAPYVCADQAAISVPNPTLRRRVITSSAAGIARPARVTAREYVKFCGNGAARVQVGDFHLQPVTGKE